MKTRTPLIRAAVGLAFAGSLFAVAHGPIATSSAIASSTAMPTLADATVLPAMSTYADATNPDSLVAMRLAATQNLPVTLLPTVHVTVQRSLLQAALPDAYDSLVEAAYPRLRLPQL